MGRSLGHVGTRCCRRWRYINIWGHSLRLLLLSTLDALLGVSVDMLTTACTGETQRCTRIVIVLAVKIVGGSDKKIRKQLTLTQHWTEMFDVQTGVDAMSLFHKFIPDSINEIFTWIIIRHASVGSITEERLGELLQRCHFGRRGIASDNSWSGSDLYTQTELRPYYYVATPELVIHSSCRLV